MSWNDISSFEKKIEDKSISIAIVGLGYVGLPLAMTFAKKRLQSIWLRHRQKKNREPPKKRKLPRWRRMDRRYP
ncbi:MAG: hypothetical protein V1718_04725 [archaeon]